MTFIGTALVRVMLIVAKDMRDLSSWGFPEICALVTTLIAGTLITVNVVLANYGFKRIPAMVGGNLMTSELVFILILGYLIYGEIPTLRAAVGGGIIAASVIMLTYFENRTARPE